MKIAPKKVFIPGEIHLLSGDEVISLVTRKKLENIKAKDKEPLFVMMTVGNEGESKGRLYKGKLSDGVELETWYKQLWPVKAIKELILCMANPKEVPVYENHAIGEANKDRVSVGKVVASTQKIIKGLTHAVCVAYIKNKDTGKKIKDGLLDICSIEASCLFSVADNSFHYVVESVENLLGIALSSSAVDTPGFDDAHILAVVTALAKKDEKEESEDEGVKKMTLDEVVAYLKTHNITATQLFQVSEITKLPQIKDILDNEIKLATEKKDAELKSVLAELAPLKKATLQKKVGQLVEQSDLLSNQDKSFVKYLSEAIRVDIGNSTDEEVLKTAVNKEIKEQIKLMKNAGFELAADDKTRDTDKDAKSKATKENFEKRQSETTDKDDLTSYKNNPLIPEPIGSRT